MNPPLADLIQKTYGVLKDCMLRGLEGGDLSVEESEHSAGLIEKNMEQIESRGELLLFMDSLAKRYPVYQKAFITVKQESVASRDQAKLDALQAKLRSFTNFTPSNAR